MSLTHEQIDELSMLLDQRHEAMAGAANIADSATESQTIKILISPTVARNYELRGVFPDLRPVNAVRDFHARGYLYEVTLVVATKMLEDAETLLNQPRDPSTRGRNLSFGCLRRELKRELDVYKVKQTPVETDITSEAPEEIAFALDQGPGWLRDRRAWLATNRPYTPPKRRENGPPKLSIVEVPAWIPDPPGFQDYAVSKYVFWKATQDRGELKRRADRLWELWIDFLGARCPFRHTDPEWPLRYDGPDVWDLAERIPELVAQRRRRFGTTYCRLVSENGREAKYGVGADR